MSVVIRHARPDEGKAIAEIEAECFPAAEAAKLKDIEQRLLAFPENFFVAEKDGKLIGFINGCNTDERKLPDELYHDAFLHKKDGAYQTVFGLDVIPQYRRQGIAAELMETYIKWARDSGRKGVLLTCKDKLIHYYAKFGFVHQGVADSDHGGAVWNDMHLIF